MDRIVGGWEPEDGLPGVDDGAGEDEAGKIVRHIDRFDFWRWSRMALGPAGLLLGWTPLLHKKVQAKARAQQRYG